MRKVLKIKDIEKKEFRLLILKSMKDNIDALIDLSNIIEKEINKWFVEYRNSLIIEYITTMSDKNKKYMNDFLITIKRYEKISRREIQNTFNKFNRTEQQRKLAEKEEYIEILNNRIYLVEPKWKTDLSDLLKYGPKSEKINCMKIKESIKENMSHELKYALELIPERTVNAIILQKFKVFRLHINYLFMKNFRTALDTYPLIDIHVTYNKLCLNYVKFNYSDDNSLNAYIGYKKDSKIYPYSREKYNLKLGIIDEKTIESINNENIDMVDITEDEQFEVYIERFTKNDTYILNVIHGIRKEYDEVVNNENSLILRTDLFSETIHVLNSDINIMDSNDITQNVSILKNKYEQLINLIDESFKLNITSSSITDNNTSIRNNLNEIKNLYNKISITVSNIIEKECNQRNTQLVILYYIPERRLPENKVVINGKIIENLLKLLNEKGIIVILINQDDTNSILYKDFLRAICDINHFDKINNYVLDKINSFEFDNDLINKIKSHNNKILNSDKTSIKSVITRNKKHYYL